MPISIKNLSFKYSKNLNNVVDDLSLTIEDSSIMVLLGLNGCGKTTLIKLLAGLLPADAGSIEYDGVDIKNISIRDRSKKFSYVPQKTYVADDFFVRDYLTYGFVNVLKFYETPTEDQMKKVEELSEELGISHLLDKKMGKISGGERQIVTIASCLLQDTPIILLDEPTSALDLKNQNKVLSLLKDVAANKHKTIILSSHNPNHASFLESDVALMDKGKIINVGPSKDLIKIDVLKNIYGEDICYSSDLDYKEISFKTNGEKDGR